MSDTVIRVENLSKKYVLSHQKETGAYRYKSLRDTLTNSTKGLFNRFRNSEKALDSSREEFWALKDVSFEIKQGDRVGIIGRNGAGKSTLLKVLSRIVEPTKGSIHIKGRIASLLEVGTGFHPELTGRENVYLNGAILGMSKVEIRRKFDEIVEFAEVEKFLDTPVKRYSSGMYVRLAFAVAAHLEPEILIVDEVLAVGDARFQKKCLGKMEDVGKDGRTVLFVSHNMATVTTLCQTAIWLTQGQVQMEGESNFVTSKYLSHGSITAGERVFKTSSERFNFKRIALTNTNREITSLFDVRESIKIQLNYQVKQNIPNLEISIQVFNSSGIPIFTTDRSSSIDYEISTGDFISEVEIPSSFLVPGSYNVSVAAHVPNVEVLCRHESSITFEIEETGSNMSLYKGTAYGVVLVDLPWRESKQKSNNLSPI